MQDRMLIEFRTETLLEEIRQRGYACKPLTMSSNLSWNRTIESDFNENEFKWEAVHKIAGQLTPDKLSIDRNHDGLKKIIRARLYLF